MALIFLTVCIVGALSVLWALVASICMMRHFKSQEDAFSRKTLWNPMNALLSPGLLSNKGLSLRRQVGRAMLVFVGCWVLAVLLGLMAYLAR